MEADKGRNDAEIISGNCMAAAECIFILCSVLGTDLWVTRMLVGEFEIIIRFSSQEFLCVRHFVTQQDANYNNLDPRQTKGQEAGEKMHNLKLCKLHTSPNIITVIKPMGRGCLGHLSCRGG
jgi:hypothetical protein